MHRWSHLCFSQSPLIILSFNIIIPIVRKYDMKEIQAFSSASAIAHEVFAAIRTVTAFGGQKKEVARFSFNLTEAKNVGIRKGVFFGLCQGLTQMSIYLAFCMTFWYGPYLVRNECHNYSGGTVIVVFVACVQSTISITQILSSFPGFISANGSASVVFHLINRKSKIDSLYNVGIKPKSTHGTIEFDDVSFTYPSRKNALILNKINMKISKGQFVALVGQSGCGKSTVIQLIQRCYDIDSGRILLDGQDIKTLNVAWLRSHIAVVNQEPELFTGSIEENIRLGKLDATDDEVITASKMANAHNFIMEFPHNYKTSCVDRLSGGQKQRVAIARALISNPKILLLDESTSAIDNSSERIIQELLDKTKGDRTTIVVAHRLSTIRNADTIIVLDKGEIIEFGTHQQLMDKTGLYYQLVVAQQQKQDQSEHDENLISSSDQFENIAPYDQSKKLSKSKISDRFISMNHSEEIIPNKRHCGCQSFIFEILRLNLPELHWIIIGCITSVIFGATTPLYAILFSNIYESFAEQDLNKAAIKTRNVALYILLMGIIGAICQFVSSVVFAKSGEALTMRIRLMSFASMLRQEISWFDHEENNVNTLVTQLSSDASSLKGLSGHRLGFIFNAASTIVCSLTIAFLAGWKLSLITLLFVPLMIISGTLQGRTLTTLKKAPAKMARGTSWTDKGEMIASETIDKIRTVIGLHQEEYFICRYQDHFERAFSNTMITFLLQASGIAIANSVLFFIHAATFGYGNYLVERGEMEFQNVFRVFSVMTFGAMSVGRSIAMISDYKKAKASAERILKLNNRQSQIDPENEKGIILNHIVGNVEFQQVYFVYSSRSNVHVIKDLNLSVPSNQTTALVGPSGSGKSTVLSLILRFYDLEGGVILLDGHDIRSLNISWLRSQIGLVQQEPVLFNTSIRDNIAYGDNTRTVKQEEIEAAARKANIHDLVISLPDGYDTLCGSKGNQLSGGQKQRIAIARALLREPKLLLLDEATSALDAPGEKIVQDQLNLARHGRTCLTIAHRLTTTYNAEQIVVVDHGHIRESGTHEQLMSYRSIYYNLNMAEQRTDQSTL